MHQPVHPQYMPFMPTRRKPLLVEPGKASHQCPAESATRSRIMSAIRSKNNRTTELAMASLLRSKGVTGWRRGKALFGNPDFTFSSARLAIFVDGCFWHGCRDCTTLPKHNRTYWKKKIDGNQARDRKVACVLRSYGWSVCRVWEHSLSEPEKVVARIRRMLHIASARRL